MKEEEYRNPTYGFEEPGSIISLNEIDIGSARCVMDRTAIDFFPDLADVHTSGILNRYPVDVGSESEVK